MNYVIKMFDGGIAEITEDEYQKLLLNKDEKVFIPSIKQVIDKKIISRVLLKSDYLEEKAVERQKELSKMKMGILHDGTKVIRHFGQWAKEDTAYIDNKGNLQYEGIIWDQHYYPEIAKDEVKSPQEYSLWLENGKKAPYLLTQPKNTSTEFTPISDNFKEKMRVFNLKQARLCQPKN